MDEEKKIRYGINWPKIEEDIIKDLKDKIVTLKEVDEIRSNGKKIKTRIDKTIENEYNYIIEGDNYYVLCVLSATHKGIIDIIYIDPPYNTGNNDFKYNDNFVDKTDPWRHSKWLEFMHKRLFLARELLKDDGVIFISIDDNEQAPLKLLCDEVFGEENFLNNIIWHYGKMSNETKKFSNNHEYILVYGKVNTILKPSMKKGDSEYKNRFGSFLKDNKIYYGDVKHKKDKLIIKRIKSLKIEPKDLRDDLIIFDFDEIFKVDSDVIYFPTLKGNSYERIENFLNKSFGLGQKSKDLLKRLITSHPNNKNSLILDFFAGSGTTGHAVLELNKEDNGNRKFILCTNNENNICTDICYPRIRKVIEGGYPGNKTGIPTNLIYQEVKTEKMTKVQASLDINKDKVGKELIEVIKTKEETQVELKTYIKHKPLKIFTNKKKTKRCFICTGFDADFMPDALEKIIEEEIKTKSYNDVFYLPDEFVTDLEIERVSFPENIVNSDSYIFGEREIKR